MKTFKILFMLLSISFITLSCSSSDDDSDSIDHPEGFSGELVPVGQRDMALTGYDVASRGITGEFKWWNADETAGTFSGGCPDDEDYEDWFESNLSLEIAFSSDGVIYQRYSGGNQEAVGDWSWTNSSKNKVNWRNYDDEETFKVSVTYLNENNLVYYLALSNGGCTFREYLKLSY